MEEEKTIIKEDARGIAVQAIVKRIGHGITWDTADKMIENILKNWK